MVVVDLILISLCSSVRLYRKSNLSLSKIHLKTPYKRGIMIILKKVPTPKWMLPRRLNVLTDTAYPVCRQDRHFYFRFFFLLLRKASNAITRLPKAHNNVSMPMKIEMISKAVIHATSLPMYSGKPGIQCWEATTLSWVLSVKILYHVLI